MLKINVLVLLIVVFCGDSNADDALKSQAFVNISSSLERSRVTGKPLLLILEANWCRDSKALNGFWMDSIVSEFVDSNFEMVKVNVGWLEELEDPLNLVGYPIYYGTPTLLVVEPSNARVINRDSVFKWFNARNESSVTLLKYLKRMLKSEKLYASLPEDEPLPQKLIEFEKQQASILYDAYSKLGRLIKENENGTASQDFIRALEAVRVYKLQLQNDINAMYLAAEKKENIILPQYIRLDF